MWREYCSRELQAWLSVWLTAINIPITEGETDRHGAEHHNHTTRDLSNHLPSAPLPPPPLHRLHLDINLIKNVFSKLKSKISNALYAFKFTSFNQIGAPHNMIKIFDWFLCNSKKMYKSDLSNVGHRYLKAQDGSKFCQIFCIQNFLFFLCQFNA